MQTCSQEGKEKNEGRDYVGVIWSPSVKKGGRGTAVFRNNKGVFDAPRSLEERKKPPRRILLMKGRKKRKCRPQFLAVCAGKKKKRRSNYFAGEGKRGPLSQRSPEKEEGRPHWGHIPPRIAEKGKEGKFEQGARFPLERKKRKGLASPTNSSIGRGKRTVVSWSLGDRGEKEDAALSRHTPGEYGW